MLFRSGAVCGCSGWTVWALSGEVGRPCVMVAPPSRTMCLAQWVRRSAVLRVSPPWSGCVGLESLECSGRKPDDATSVDAALPREGVKTWTLFVQGRTTASIFVASPLGGVVLKMVVLVCSPVGWPHTTSWLAAADDVLGALVALRAVWQR